MGDLLTMAWKETREHFLRRGMPSKAVWGSLAIVALVGLAVPLLMANISRPLGPTFAVAVVASIGVFAMVMQGVFATVGLIIDSIAGERERHTLETLLAGPLSDRAVLGGKIFAIVAFSGIVCLVLGVVQQVELLILYGSAGWGYLGTLAAGPALGIAAALLIAAVGALVSIRVQTVKAGQQMLGFLLFPLFMLPGLAPILMRTTAFGRWVSDLYDGLGPALSAILGIGILLVLDAVLVAGAFRAFRRDRLLARR